MRRIRGLFVITRALLPFIVALGLILATWLTSRSLVDATERYGERLGAQLDAVQLAVAEANDGLEAIGAFVTSTVGAADDLLQRVGGLSDSVDIRLPDIQIPDITVLDRIIEFPDFTLGDGLLEIPIPGVEPLKAIATDLVEAGREVADPIVKVAALAAVPPQLEMAARDTTEYAGDVRSSLSEWLTAVVAIVVIAAAVWLLAAMRPISSELARGWSLLRGRPTPQVAVVDLAARVAALERRLGQEA
jgi:hypothetical protein